MQDTPADELRSFIRLSQRLRGIAGDEAAHERVVDRRSSRAIRAAIGRIIAERADELIGTSDLYEQWSTWRRRFGSCEYVQVIRNPLTGTELGYPFSCRVPGCPFCEVERVADVRERYLPIVQAATAPKASTLTMPNVRPGQLAAAWSALGAAMLNLWHSPLFTGERYCRPGRGCLASSRPEPRSCAGHRRRCRPGMVGCLSGVDLAQRRACHGRCRKPRPRMSSTGWAVHVACRPCRGHEPVRGALFALEATVNRDESTWHPHANLLHDGAYLLHSWLAGAWRLALERQLRRELPAAFVWIRDARRAPPGHRGDWSAAHSLRETVKYAIKPDAKLIDSSAPRWFVEWAEARHGRRLVRSYGGWRGEQDTDDDEAYEAELEPTAGDEQVRYLEDPDSRRRYPVPVLDPLTDEPADWELAREHAPRARFTRYTPERAGARAWVVSHPLLPDPPP